MPHGREDNAEDEEEEHRLRPKKSSTQHQFFFLTAILTFIVGLILAAVGIVFIIVSSSKGSGESGDAVNMKQFSLRTVVNQSVVIWEKTLEDPNSEYFKEARKNVTDILYDALISNARSPSSKFQSRAATNDGSVKYSVDVSMFRRADDGVNVIVYAAGVAATTTTHPLPTKDDITEKITTVSSSKNDVTVDSTAMKFCETPYTDLPTQSTSVAPSFPSITTDSTENPCTIKPCPPCDRPTSPPPTVCPVCPTIHTLPTTPISCPPPPTCPTVTEATCPPPSSLPTIPTTQQSTPSILTSTLFMSSAESSPPPTTCPTCPPTTTCPTCPPVTTCPTPPPTTACPSCPTISPSSTSVTSSATISSSALFSTQTTPTPSPPICPTCPPTTTCPTCPSTTTYPTCPPPSTCPTLPPTTPCPTCPTISPSSASPSSSATISSSLPFSTQTTPTSSPPICPTCPTCPPISSTSPGPSTLFSTHPTIAVTCPESTCSPCPPSTCPTQSSSTTSHSTTNVPTSIVSSTLIYPNSSSSINPTTPQEFTCPPTPTCPSTTCPSCPTCPEVTLMTCPTIIPSTSSAYTMSTTISSPPTSTILPTSSSSETPLPTFTSPQPSSPSESSVSSSVQPATSPQPSSPSESSVSSSVQPVTSPQPSSPSESSVSSSVQPVTSTPFPTSSDTTSELTTQSISSTITACSGREVSYADIFFMFDFTIYNETEDETNAIKDFATKTLFSFDGNHYGLGRDSVTAAFATQIFLIPYPNGQAMTTIGTKTVTSIDNMATLLSALPKEYLSNSSDIVKGLDFIGTITRRMNVPPVIVMVSKSDLFVASALSTAKILIQQGFRIMTIALNGADLSILSSGQGYNYSFDDPNISLNIDSNIFSLSKTCFHSSLPKTTSISPPSSTSSSSSHSFTPSTSPPCNLAVSNQSISFLYEELFQGTRNDSNVLLDVFKDNALLSGKSAEGRLVPFPSSSKYLSTITQFIEINAQSVSKFTNFLNLVDALNGGMSQAIFSQVNDGLQFVTSNPSAKGYINTIVIVANTDQGVQNAIVTAKALRDNGYRLVTVVIGDYDLSALNPDGFNSKVSSVQDAAAAIRSGILQISSYCV